MFITADQLLCHAIGDYVFQSDWMAASKTQKTTAALAHVVTYTVPFLALTTSWKALLFIAGTHFVIDRWRLARYVCWAKNWLAPKWLTIEEWACETCGQVDPTERGELDRARLTCPCRRGQVVPRKRSVANKPWSECAATGYPADKPMWLTVWLMIIADNIMHVLLNAVALRWLV